jgi:hypothetical protein
MNEFLSQYFETARTVPLVAPDLTPVGEDVLHHFRSQEFEVSGSRLGGGGWHISIHKGDWFKAILGLKTALNIRIEPAAEGTRISAGIGIFELQALPTVITLFVFTPVVFGQIWGILQQQKLDDEAVRYVEDRLAHRAGTTPPGDGSAPRRDDARAAAERELGDPVFPADRL